MVLQCGSTVLMSLMYMNLKVLGEMSSDPSFLSMDQAGIGQQAAATTLDCGSSPPRPEGQPLRPFHHHSSGLCFVVSYALITSDCETIPFSS